MLEVGEAMRFKCVMLSPAFSERFTVYGGPLCYSVYTEDAGVCSV